MDQSNPGGSQPDAAPKRRAPFVIPSHQETADYFAANGGTRSQAKAFWYFYDAKDWMVGKNKMVRWTSAASRWIAENGEGGTSRGAGSAAPAEVPSYHRKAVLPPPSGPQVTHEQIEAARARARPASDAARTGGRP